LLKKFFTCYSIVIIPNVPTLSLHHYLFLPNLPPPQSQTTQTTEGTIVISQKHYTKASYSHCRLCSFQSGNNQKNKTPFSVYPLCSFSDFTESHANPKSKNLNFLIFIENPLFSTQENSILVLFLIS